MTGSFSREEKRLSAWHQLDLSYCGMTLSVVPGHFGGLTAKAVMMSHTS